jgi:hypothetical protein
VGISVAFHWCDYVTPKISWQSHHPILHVCGGVDGNIDWPLGHLATTAKSFFAATSFFNFGEGNCDLQKFEKLATDNTDFHR